MSGLQEAFYILGILFMSLMLAILLALLVAVLVIRKKITALSDTVHSKIDAVSNITAQGAKLVNTVATVAKKKAG